MENIFYNYHLKNEIKRREEAIELHKKCDYNTLRNNYIHYLKQERKVENLTDLSLDGVINQLTSIKNKLPKNSTGVSVAIRTETKEGIFGRDEAEGIACVEWIEYSIEDENKCSSLAKCWARDSDWKMKYQPNGKDGKKAQELYDKLISNQPF